MLKPPDKFNSAFTFRERETRFVAILCGNPGSSNSKWRRHCAALGNWGEAAATAVLPTKFVSTTVTGRSELGERVNMGCRAAITRVGFCAMFAAFFGAAAAGAAIPSIPAGVASVDGPPTHLAINVTATVQPQCGFADGFEPHAPPTIEATGGPIAAVRIPFRLACNDEFTIQVTSANGGLRSDADPASLARASANGFRTEASYTLRLDIVRDEGGDLTETCTSQQLMTGAGCNMASAGQNSEFPSTAGESAMTIEFPEAVVPGGYVAGHYQDVLTVTVGTRT